MKVPYHTLHILTTPLDKNKPSHANPKLTAKRKMILTNCAACAAPLTHDAPRCIRCKIRYCDATEVALRETPEIMIARHVKHVLELLHDIPKELFK